MAEPNKGSEPKKGTVVVDKKNNAANTAASDEKAGAAATGTDEEKDNKEVVANETKVIPKPPVTTPAAKAPVVLNTAKSSLTKIGFLKDHKMNIGTEKFEYVKGNKAEVETHIASRLVERGIAHLMS